MQAIDGVTSLRCANASVTGPGETKRTAVSIYDDPALVEVSEDAPPGGTLDLFVVP